MSDFPISVSVIADEGDSWQFAPEGHEHQFFDEPITLTMLSGWTNDSSFPLKVFKSADFCFVNGIVTGTNTPANDPIATLPVLYRPAYALQLYVSDLVAIPAGVIINVQTNGDIIYPPPISGSESIHINFAFRTV